MNNQTKTIGLLSTEATKQAALPPPLQSPITEARRREAAAVILRGASTAGLGMAADEVGVLVAGIKTLQELEELEERARALVNGTNCVVHQTRIRIPASPAQNASPPPCWFLLVLLRFLFCSVSLLVLLHFPACSAYHQHIPL